MIRPNLLDLNVLIALSETDHRHHAIAYEWFERTGKLDWGVCAFTEAGFLRITTNPNYSPVARPSRQAIEVLRSMKSYPGYHYWKIEEALATVIEPVAERIFGHQQVTDAFLLGLVIRNNGVLVTFDKGIRYLAGEEFKQHLLVLEAI